MDSRDAAPWFVGDCDDPWVAGIAAALPRGTTRLSCPGALPDAWPDKMAAARTLVLHRAHLTNGDAERIRRLRDRQGPPIRVILCVGPNARYRDVERWSVLVDAILPEATAQETVARHLATGEEAERPEGPRPSVLIVSGQYELRRVLAEACEAAGYPATEESAWPAAEPSGLAVWDVPALDEDWPGVLERQTRGCRVITLIGFADRVSVSLARSLGAAACLDLPCDPADITFLLDRLALRGTSLAPELALAEPSHIVPPPPRAARRPRRVRVQGAETRGRTVANPGLGD
jgi:hypothetical protein